MPARRFTKLSMTSQKGRFMKLARMLRPHHMRADNDGGRHQGGQRFGEGYGRGFGGNGYRFNQGNGEGRGRMQNLMNDDSDQGSQL